LEGKKWEEGCLRGRMGGCSEKTLVGEKSLPRNEKIRKAGQSGKGKQAVGMLGKKEASVSQRKTQRERYKNYWGESKTTPAQSGTPFGAPRKKAQGVPYAGDKKKHGGSENAAWLEMGGGAT